MVISNLASWEIQWPDVEVEHRRVVLEACSKLSNPLHDTANSVPTLRLPNLKNHKNPVEPNLDIQWAASASWLPAQYFNEIILLWRLSFNGRVQFENESCRCKWLYKGYWFSCPLTSTRWHLRCSRIYCLCPISYTGRMTLACFTPYMTTPCGCLS